MKIHDLSPMLFNMFVNSVSKYLSRVKILLYTDDKKIFHRIKVPEDCSLLQDELNQFSDLKLILAYP